MCLVIGDRPVMGIVVCNSGGRGGSIEIRSIACHYKQFCCTLSKMSRQSWVFEQRSGMITLPFPEDHFCEETRTKAESQVRSDCNYRDEK